MIIVLYFGGLILLAAAALYVAACLSDRPEKTIGARDAKWLEDVEIMHRSRVLIPGLDAPLYIHESPRREAGVTPKGQPARGGAPDLGPGAGGATAHTFRPGYNSHLPSGEGHSVATAAKVDSPAPDDPGAAEPDAGQAGPPAAPGLPETVEAEFDKARATLAELSRPDDDAQRFPWLMPQWADGEGTFTATCLDGET